MDLQNLTLEDAIGQICILAEFAEEQLTGDPLELELEQVKNAATGWLGEMLARKRISALRDSMRAKPARKPKPVKVSIPPAVDDMAEALREPLADAIEADIEADKPGKVAETAAGLHQQTIRESALPTGPAIGQIKDPGKFMALVAAGFSKKQLAEDFKCDVRAIEEYCRVMRIKLHPGKRKSTVRALENFTGEAM